MLAPKCRLARVLGPEWRSGDALHEKYYPSRHLFSVYQPYMTVNPVDDKRPTHRVIFLNGRKKTDIQLCRNMLELPTSSGTTLRARFPT